MMLSWVSRRLKEVVRGQLSVVSCQLSVDGVLIGWPIIRASALGVPSRTWRDAPLLGEALAVAAAN
jgi:hypothetical protein